jgi:hypothetical protein
MKDLYYQISVSEYAGKHQYRHTEIGREYDKDKAIEAANELVEQIQSGTIKLADISKSFCVCITEFKYNYVLQAYRHSPVDNWTWATRDYYRQGDGKWK